MGNNEAKLLPQSTSDIRTPEDIKEGVDEGIRRIITLLRENGIQSLQSLQHNSNWGNVQHPQLPMYFPTDVSSQFRNDKSGSATVIEAKTEANKYAHSMTALANQALMPIFGKKLENNTTRIGLAQDPNQVNLEQAAFNILNYFSAVVTLAAFSASLAIRASNLNLSQIEANILSQYSEGTIQERVKLRNAAGRQVTVVRQMVVRLLTAVDKTLQWLASGQTPEVFNDHHAKIYSQLDAANRQICQELYQLRFSTFILPSKTPGSFDNYFELNGEDGIQQTYPVNKLPKLKSFPTAGNQVAGPCVKPPTWSESLRLQKSATDKSYIYPAPAGAAAKKTEAQAQK